ncbi:zinc ABC transporter permease [Kiloniella litopenaei]|uniref:Zinc ABC transporter permease n=1 Tax=Kiloniella litopenaei TaxID=1549748 RepID=A0A0M2R5M9_9PROT|nr:metal ABC transporter permease [Kiloniella litopenaei]KKJ76996.1 zinc ABC transporter permease [Kiloniella litopenaei]
MLQELFDILTFQSGYNTNVVLLGAGLLGTAGGVVGVFSLLRKRALISDAISHATLPGITLGFLVALALTGTGKSLPFLMVGSTLSGILGVLLVQWIKDNTRLPEDSAIGTVLSSFFGLGVVLMSYIQTLKSGSQAGLESYLLGSTASMLQSEAEMIAVSALVITLLAVLFMKEFGLVCFDPDYAASRGWAVSKIDLLMMALLLAVVVIGLKTVGLILIIALVIIPPVAARFWTDRLGIMVAISAFTGGLSCYLGAALSALTPDLPSGATIVLTATALFTLSLLFAPKRGVIATALRQFSFRLKITRRRALLSLGKDQVSLSLLASFLLKREGVLNSDHSLTEKGQRTVEIMSRDQALWNQYLNDYPEEAFAQNRWSLAMITDILPRDLIKELEMSIDSPNKEIG